MDQSSGTCRGLLMVISIPKKQSASNKIHTVGDKAPTPFIDKLSIVLDLDATTEGASVYAGFMAAQQDKTVFKPPQQGENGASSSLLPASP